MVFAAKDKKSNPDGSVSLYTLQASRSAWSFPLSGTKSDPKGVCAAYGFDSYLEETLEHSGDVQKSLIINKESLWWFELYQDRTHNTQITAPSKLLPL
ncbi:MAG: hypothetical protein R3B54_10200 [Bdellovibrionota bacterium]